MVIFWHWNTLRKFELRVSPSSCYLFICRFLGKKNSTCARRTPPLTSPLGEMVQTKFLSPTACERSFTRRLRILQNQSPPHTDPKSCFSCHLLRGWIECWLRGAVFTLPLVKPQLKGRTKSNNWLQLRSFSPTRYLNNIFARRNVRFSNRSHFPELSNCIHLCWGLAALNFNTLLFVPFLYNF